MVQPKYNPQEALERVKLLMKYDNTKTLTENRQIILEQATDRIVSREDLMGDTSWWGNINWSRRTGVKGVVDALDGWVSMNNLKYVYESIKFLDNKCYFDESAGKYISATEAFARLYEEDEGEKLIDDVDDVGTVTLDSSAKELKNQIIGAIKTQIAKGCNQQTPDPNPDPVKEKTCQEDPSQQKCKKNKKKEGQVYPECEAGIYKRGCWHLKVKEVQICLGVNPAYGNFGPKTAAALLAKFPDKRYHEQFVDADIPIICNKNTPTPTPTASEDPADDREEITVYDPNEI